MTNIRERLVETARSLFTRGLTHGSTGNLSVRTESGIIVTPTGASLGTVQPGDLSTIDETGRHIAGPRPSKEAFLHAAMLRARPTAHAVVHTHSTFAAAISCLDDLDDRDALPPLTAYYVMRVGRLHVLPYFAPGDAALEQVAERAAATDHALLLRNHGPIVAAATLAAATDVLEELEETAKLFILLRGHNARPLNDAQRAAIYRAS